MSNTFLAKLDQAMLLLAEAKTIQQAHQIVSMASAAAQYAKEANLSVEAYNYAAEIKVRAERRLGEILKVTPKNEGAKGNPGGQGAPLVQSQNGTAQPPPKLADIGITKKQSARAQKIAAIPEAEFEQQIEATKAGGELLSDATLLRQQKQRRAREEAVKLTIPADVPAGDERFTLYETAVADCPLADASVDFIITDPPYERTYLPAYGELAVTAARVLKPGGSLLVMVGQSYLPDILALISPHLRYHWTVAYETPGGQAVQLWKRNVNTFWKPVLWFVKGTYAGRWIGDVVKSSTNDNDKRFHEWGQSVSGMADLVERFTYPGQSIFDPFCGAGTTGVVALTLGRPFIGADIDGDALATTRARLGVPT